MIKHIYGLIQYQIEIVLERELSKPKMAARISEIAIGAKIKPKTKISAMYLPDVSGSSKKWLNM